MNKNYNQEVETPQNMQKEFVELLAQAIQEMKQIETLEQAIQSIGSLAVLPNKNLQAIEVHNLGENESNSCCHCIIS